MERRHRHGTHLARLPQLTGWLRVQAGPTCELQSGKVVALVCGRYRRAEAVYALLVQEDPPSPHFSGALLDRRHLTVCVVAAAEGKVCMQRSSVQLAVSAFGRCAHVLFVARLCAPPRCALRHPSLRRQMVATVADAFPCSAVCISPDGRYVYAYSRGSSSSGVTQWATEVRPRPPLSRALAS